jgi:hypothetical protein
MAINEPGFIQKHIEKIVMAVCLIVLLVSVVHFGMGTPRKIELDSQDVSPSDVDRILYEKAEAVNNRIEKFTLEEQAPPNFLATLNELQQAPLQGVQLVRAVFGAPKATGIGGIREEQPELPTLADVQAAMPAPPQPKSWAGIEIVDREAEALSEEPVWRAGLLYDWRELNESWTQAMRGTIIVPTVVCVGYELEIEVRKPDGTWEPAPGVKPVRQTQAAIPKIPAYDPQADNAQAVRQAIATFYADNYAWVDFALHPKWWPIYTDEGPAEWTLHFPYEVYEAFNDKQALADGTPSGLYMPPLPPQDAYEPPPTVDPSETRSRRSPSPRRTTDDDDINYGPSGPTYGPSEPSYGPPTSPRPERRSTPTRQTRRDDDVAEGFEVPTMPTLDEQIDMGVWLAWFHTNQVEFNREYRCRMRLTFVNPLLTYPQEVDAEHKEDANVPTVQTPWSPWSDPVRVEQLREFYITGDNPSLNSVTVTIFTTSLGQPVMQRFSGIKPGTVIGEMAKVDVYNPKTQAVEEREVDFTTGAIAMDFDFENRVESASGIERRDTAMVFYNYDGQINRRSMYSDSKDTRYQQLLADAEQAASRIEPERPRPTLDERRRSPRRSSPRSRRSRDGDEPDIYSPPPPSSYD